MKRRISARALAAALILGGALSSAFAAPGKAGVRVVTDAFGRQVTVPATVRTAAAIGGAARTMTYAGCADALVGVTDMDKKNLPAMPYSVVNAARFAALPSVGSGGANDRVYIEELVRLDPDVIIAHTDEATAKTVAEKTGIPTVGVYPVDMFDQSFYQALTVIGEVMGTTDHCAKVVAYVKSCREDLDSRTRDIPEGSKPSVYTGAVSFRGGHGFEGTYANYPPFAAIHARNVADQTGQKSAFLVDIEKVLVWDPDIIFLNPSNMSLVNAEYAKNKAFYDGLGAIRKGKVYSQIAYNYNWTNMEIAIADAYYAGVIVFPDRFKDVDPVRKADEIFTVMLGTPFYGRLAAAGLSFSTIRIGE